MVIAYFFTINIILYCWYLTLVIFIFSFYKIKLCALLLLICSTDYRVSEASKKVQIISWTKIRSWRWFFPWKKSLTLVQLVHSTSNPGKIVYFITLENNYLLKKVLLFDTYIFFSFNICFSFCQSRRILTTQILAEAFRVFSPWNCLFTVTDNLHFCFKSQPRDLSGKTWQTEKPRWTL